MARRPLADSFKLSAQSRWAARWPVSKTSRSGWSSSQPASRVTSPGCGVSGRNSVQLPSTHERGAGGVGDLDNVFHPVRHGGEIIGFGGHAGKHATMHGVEVHHLFQAGRGSKAAVNWLQTSLVIRSQALRTRKGTCMGVVAECPLIKPHRRRPRTPSRPTWTTACPCCACTAHGPARRCAERTWRDRAYPWRGCRFREAATGCKTRQGIMRTVLSTYSSRAWRGNVRGGKTQVEVAGKCSVVLLAEHRAVALFVEAVEEDAV